MKEPLVLLVDDDDDLRPAIIQGLEIEGLNIKAFASAEDALHHVNQNFHGAIVSDIRMPGIDGMAFLKRILEIDPALPVALITGHGDVTLAVEAMREGAYDFIEKPFSLQHLVTVVRRAIERRRLVLENRMLRQALDQSGGIETRLLGRNQAMQHLRHEISILAETDVDVLVLGETGTGKEVVARALHDFGPRKTQNFVAINCGAVPENIFESELFGHEAGAFTGASKMRVGKLQFANGGTVFLDEIESMPMDLQVKLLRSIEQRSIERLGSNKSIALNLRFIAATKSDLNKNIEQGTFRADLFYRLNVAALKLPPLRERKDDIPLLFAHLAREARARYRRDIPSMTPLLENQLLNHDWPGNVRELRNIADRWVLGLWTGFSEGVSMLDQATLADGTLAERMATFEKAVIIEELKRWDGRMKDTYESLSLSRKGLYDKIKKYEISLAQKDDQESNVDTPSNIQV